MPKARSIITLAFCGWSTCVSAACPSLSSFYPEKLESPDSLPAWEGVRIKLSENFSQCLLSSEYFALLGAAQLNSDHLPEAMESLERALLLDPDNGAALIDYADALLQDGQLFAAIEANAMLLEREDVPNILLSQISQRHRDWSALTQQTSWQLDLLGGYDNNLNGAPDEDLITLTLSGEPILLSLSEEFQAAQGPFLNASLVARHRRLTPNAQHSFQGQVRGRLSENTASDVLQVAGRYSRLVGKGSVSRQWGGGINRLLFSGRPLFTGTDARYRFQFAGAGQCRPYLSGALQHQIWHEQRRLDGVEVKASFGASCPLAGDVAQRIKIEGSALHNAERNADRLGGNREGWQLLAEWQMALTRGVVSAQVTHTRLLDGRGFSPLLQNNARRDMKRSSILVQYREAIAWLGGNTQLVINFYHQDQNSNLGLFETEDTSFEVGFSWEF